MPTIVYRITSLLKALLRRAPLGTNLGLVHLFWALMSGRFLQSREAIFPALSDLGLCPAAVRRASPARALWHLYRDRWPIEQLPLAGKQMLGAERSSVFTKTSQQCLPLLVLLAGNVLSYVAASSAPVAMGFWDAVVAIHPGNRRHLRPH